MSGIRLSRRSGPFGLSATQQATRRRLSAGCGDSMASNTDVMLKKDEVSKNEGPETPPDSPLLDLSDAAVKKLIRSAKKRGYVTHEQINSLSKEVNSEQILY